MTDWNAIRAEVHRDVQEVSEPVQVMQKAYQAGPNPAAATETPIDFRAVWIEQREALRAGLTPLVGQKTVLLTIPTATTPIPAPGDVLVANGERRLIEYVKTTAPDGATPIVHHIIVPKTTE